MSIFIDEFIMWGFNLFFFDFVKDFNPFSEYDFDLTNHKRGFLTEKFLIKGYFLEFIFLL